MKIGLLGFGRMGKVIKEIAEKRGHSIVSIVDEYGGAITDEADVYIDFSTATAFLTNAAILCEKKIPVVIGTTGWLEKKVEIEALFHTHHNIGVWGGNFSLGVNLFWKALRESTKIFDAFPEYDSMVHEFHHKNKVDSPSGTALETARIMLQSSSRKKRIITETLERKREDDELHVSSTRGGSIPGIHTVLFDSDFDTIEITHTARTREGFALGSVIAAEKITKLHPGLHNFTEVFDTIVRP